MSKQKNIEIQCPYCGEEALFQIWESVNVSINPELKKKILSKEIFDFTCPACKGITMVQYGPLYHDMDKGLMFMYSDNKQHGMNSFTFMKMMLGRAERDDYVTSTYSSIEELLQLILLHEE